MAHPVCILNSALAPETLCLYQGSSLDEKGRRDEASSLGEDIFTLRLQPVFLMQEEERLVEKRVALDHLPDIVSFTSIQYHHLLQTSLTLL